MPKPSRKLPFISISIYASVVFVLLYLAIFTQGFSMDFRDVRISGRYAPFPLLGSRTVRELTLSYNGLEFSFSRAVPLACQTPGAGIRTFPLNSVETYSDGVDILFEGGFTAHLKAAPGSEDAYTLAFDALPESSGTAVLAVPFKLRAVAKKSDDAPILAWTLKGKSFILSLSAASRFDSDSGKLLLSFESGKSGRDVRFSSTEASLADPYASWLSIESPQSDQVFRQRLEAFADAAYAGWSKSRVSSDGTLWRNSEGIFKFSEELGQALIAESIKQGAYQKHRSQYQQALAYSIAQSAGSAITLSSSPYTGNLKDFLHRLQAREAKDVETIRARLAANDMTIFDLPGLVPFLLDHGPFSLAQDVLSLLEEPDRAGWDASCILGMLEACLDCFDYVDSSDAIALRASVIIEKRILPLIRKTNKGIFLVEKRGSPVDVRESLHASFLLDRAAVALKLPVLDSIARGLLSAALGLQKDMAFLPAFITLSENEVAGTQGLIPPESIYRFVMTDGYLPREIPLYATLGPGTWIWTAARLEAAEGRPESLAISLRFPAGLPHYLIIHGIKPISQLSLHGAAWRPDADYTRYSDGWTYDAEEKTLYAKLTNRQEIEQILITY